MSNDFDLEKLRKDAEKLDQRAQEALMQLRPLKAAQLRKRAARFRYIADRWDEPIDFYEDYEN
jgi:hypothetical protein